MFIGFIGGRSLVKLFDYVSVLSCDTLFLFLFYLRIHTYILIEGLYDSLFCLTFSHTYNKGNTLFNTQIIEYKYFILFLNNLYQ